MRASSWPSVTSSPLATRISCCGESLKLVSYDSVWLTRTVIGWSPDAGGTSTVPSISVMVAWPLGMRASNSSSTRGSPWVMSSPATPPVWKVRIVSWVPGSPMDWAAMIPTAWPSSTSSPVARLRP
jgi:hypothetical protein